MDFLCGALEVVLRAKLNWIGWISLEVYWLNCRGVYWSKKKWNKPIIFRIKTHLSSLKQRCNTAAFWKLGGKFGYFNTPTFSTGVLDSLNRLILSLAHPLSMPMQTMGFLSVNPIQNAFILDFSQWTLMSYYSSKFYGFIIFSILNLFIFHRKA